MLAFVFIVVVGFFVSIIMQASMFIQIACSTALNYGIALGQALARLV